MKILIISHMYPSSFNKIGGIFVHQQVKELKKQGCEITVVSPIPWTPFPIKYLSKKWKEYYKIPQKTILENIKVYYPRYLEIPKNLFYASSGKRMYLGIKKTITKIYENFKFDIIHSHVALPDGYCGMMVAQEYNKSLIVTIHGQDFQQTIFKNVKCKKNIEKVINFSKKTITVSNKLNNIGKKKLKINSKKLITIPNGINTKHISQKKSNLSKKYENKKIILSVSSLIKTKGIDYNLKAIARIRKKYPEIIYLIIGDGPEKENLKELANKLDISNQIEFLGQMSHKKVMEYLSICDIFSLPSWNEGFGIVYLEAMAHQKPIIGVVGQGINDVIENKKNGLLIEPKNINSLVETLNFLLYSPEIIRKIGKGAQKTVLEKYTLRKVVKQIINFY